MRREKTGGIGDLNLTLIKHNILQGIKRDIIVLYLSKKFIFIVIK